MASSQPALQLSASAARRVSGKSWKTQKSATRRSQLPDGVKTKHWEDRMEKTKRDSAVKKLQADLREEKRAEIQRRKDITLERKKLAEEKQRIEEAKAKMGARKAARLQRRAGRSKKVNG